MDPFAWTSRTLLQMIAERSTSDPKGSPGKRFRPAAFVSGDPCRFSRRSSLAAEIHPPSAGDLG
jgi:hypothetical protein